MHLNGGLVRQRHKHGVVLGDISPSARVAPSGGHVGHINGPARDTATWGLRCHRVSVYGPRSVGIWVTAPDCAVGFRLPLGRPAELFVSHQVGQPTSRVPKQLSPLSCEIDM